MADVAAPSPQPVKVEYDSITGVPSEFNEFLPKDSEEYKRWNFDHFLCLCGDAYFLDENLVLAEEVAFTCSAGDICCRAA